MRPRPGRVPGRALVPDPCGCPRLDCAVRVSSRESRHAEQVESNSSRRMQHMFLRRHYFSNVPQTLRGAPGWRTPEASRPENYSVNRFKACSWRCRLTGMCPAEGSLLFEEKCRCRSLKSRSLRKMFRLGVIAELNAVFLLSMKTSPLRLDPLAPPQEGRPNVIKGDLYDL